MANQGKENPRIENLLQNYEEMNQKLQEKEEELKTRLKMMENTMPALMMWNMWRMLLTMNQAQTLGLRGLASANTVGSSTDQLRTKLHDVEQKFNNVHQCLQESKQVEKALQDKAQDLEMKLQSRNYDISQILERGRTEDVEAFEKLSRMAKERLQTKKRIKDLETQEKMYQEALQEVDKEFIPT